jgi:hypothetical protein
LPRSLHILQNSNPFNSHFIAITIAVCQQSDLLQSWSSLPAVWCCLLHQHKQENTMAGVKVISTVMPLQQQFIMFRVLNNAQRPLCGADPAAYFCLVALILQLLTGRATFYGE